MSLRPPDLEALRRPRATGYDILGAELMAERATALGAAGEAVQKALAVLRAAPLENPAVREPALKAASTAVWAYFVQRESLGLRDHREVIALYGIPGEVLARLGASD